MEARELRIVSLLFPPSNRGGTLLRVCQEGLIERRRRNPASAPQKLISSYDPHTVRNTVIMHNIYFAKLRFSID